MQFGVDMNSSIHVDNKGKVILSLGEGPTQGLDDTTLTAEAKYLINFQQSGKIFLLSRYTIMEAKVSFFLKIQQYINSMQKNSEIKDYALRLGNVSKDFTINNIEKQE